ncbi:phospholipase A [Scleromatobacter humisilvae]|uniref:Phospholipase A1 n=1 Tax=Scleromatobacter humisilvae TaxID=2897159 RepID=A0A9X2BYR3_9BURK|nr:phospholipase A [Scleromatobacter humisilvae]MCK9685607.1 phospholipase A [Scleromatobacter humisilvae]
MKPTASRLIRALAVAFPAVASAAQDPASCVGLDDAKRLACYDAIYRPVPSAVQPIVPPVARDEPSAREQVATAPSGRGLEAGDYLAKFWELAPEDKRGTFVVRTYQPNFLLPAHYSTSINRAPSSPTHPDGGSFPQYRQTEAELQLSLRAKALENVGFSNADVWLAYTQQSIWQMWNGQDSAPFRSSDYQPEGFYVVPIPDKMGDLGGGWRWRMVQLGVAHESNGYGLPLSRSWNYAYLGTNFTRDDFALRARFNQRLGEQGVDDNPHIADYIGSTELGVAWLPGETTMQLTARTSFKDWNRGSLKFEWTRPVWSAKPDGLRWYVQLFSGYGETMLDYNHRQTSIGLGFTLFQL